MNPAPAGFDPASAARLLLAAHRGGPRPLQREVCPPDRAMAFAVQDATLAVLGPVGGWKVGAKGPQAEPTCAPLPASGLLPSGCSVASPTGAMRGMELEVAVQLGRDLHTHGRLPDAAELASAIDAVLPVIEVVETRLADWRGSDPLAQLADLQSHGVLVMGAPVAVRRSDLDLRQVRASLAFDGQPVADTRGGNPAQDLWRLLAWLAMACAHRGQPLRAGQIITTGSCTGMLFAPQGARVVGEIQGLGRVELRV